VAAAERIQAFTNTLANAVSTAGILGSSEAARYWAYHLSRSGFFMLQGLAGLLASRNAVGRGGGGDSPAVNRFEAVFRQARQLTCSGGGGGRQAGRQCSTCSAGGWHNSTCSGDGRLSVVPPCCRRGWVGPVTEALLMFYQDHELVKEGE
jgi:hypothetical protein